MKINAVLKDQSSNNSTRKILEMSRTYPQKRTFLSPVIIGVITLFSFNNSSFSQTQTEQLDKLLGKYHEIGQFNGSVLVANQGTVLYKKGFGLANMEWDIPNAPNTKHRLGSITKQFTAMLILQLAADGKLDLHVPITTYLPDYPKTNGDRITTHQLLTHSSGIPNYTSFPRFFEDHMRNPYTPKDFTKLFQDLDLEFNPGQLFSYSNSGYFLLGVLIEEISGKSYEAMLQEKIFTPLGMNDTGFDHHTNILKNRATGYGKNGTNYVNSDYLDMSIPYAAGSMYSTVEDLYTWDQALYTTKLLSKKYMDLYFKPYIKSWGNFHYAYGWSVGKVAIGNSTDSIDIITHSGGINGFNTDITRSISDKSLIVLLNNTGSAPLDEIAQAIQGILHGKPYDLPKEPLASALITVIEEKGIKEGIRFFNANKNSTIYALNESEINDVGYQLMRSGQIEEAAEVFKLNVDAFPESFNAYDSYAEALMNLGRNEEAVANYKISVEINPANQNGIDMLKKLGVNTDDLIKEVIVPDALLETYVGKYELMPAFILTVTKEGSQLKGQATGQPILDLFPKSIETFYLKEVQAQLTFNKGENGQIESLTLVQGGQEIIGKKLAE